LEVEAAACGITRDALGALTIPEIETALEGAWLREARTRRMVAEAVVNLLSPYLEKGSSVPWIVEGMLGGDPEAKVLVLRQKRLTSLADGDE